MVENSNKGLLTSSSFDDTMSEVNPNPRSKKAPAMQIEIIVIGDNPEQDEKIKAAVAARIAEKMREMTKAPAPPAPSKKA